MTLRAGVYFNALALVIAVTAIWFTRHHDIGSMLITLVFLMYILLLNIQQRDCFPFFIIFAVFKIIELPIATAFFDSSRFYQYLAFIASYDLALVIFIIIFHQNAMLRKIAGVTTPLRKIKQVNAFSAVITLGMLHLGVIAAEVYNYQQNDGGLFFYNTFSEFRSIFKIAEFFVLWSIYLDSQMQFYIKNDGLIATIKANKGR